MTRKLIQKIIDELQMDKPRIDYVLGILETALESLPEEKTTFMTVDDLPIRFGGPNKTTTAPVIDIETALEKGTAANLANIKKLAEQSME